MLDRPDVAAAPFRPAARIADIGVSEILQIGARAAAMRREGHDVIVLGAGEPDFDTPDTVKDAALRAMQRGETRYTALDGSPAMKEAVQEKFRRDNGLDFSAGEVSVASGAKQVIFNAFMATLDPGDEVIVPTPYWTSYADIIRIAGGVPVLVACDAANGFRLTAAQLERAITPATRWLMLNSPSNPTGAAYSEADYRPLLDVLVKHPHVWLLADDIYEHIVYDGFRFVTPVALEPALRERTLTVNGVSKAYAMTGWRIGYGAGPAALIRAMAVVQSQSTSNPSSISQAAAIEALTGPQDYLDERRDSFRVRRDLVVDGLNGIDGIDCPRPQGAFYTFASCAGMLGRATPRGRKIETDGDFCAYLLDAAKVAVVPGSAFGASPFFRISYATSQEELREALARIAVACAALAA
ncbi:pyridoxal phosphate-dependent aminotransferase [Aquamicrobium defluvii]|uniref:Aminotransferase n=1 Tax=Aquamicrobium defluvii TaxID=69279 RepID=A0A011U5X9_9HYPH|nr:pyridoxal phosphate-dependent aminotransferase [Aquamicrobium defluvii]EXL01283.1 aspartate aminotransferase [Aquamicrobium defluvii]EZQ12563.1 aspartate aminotransferase [Halopseudomonas bauzanensis]TDR27856.1 aspartate aminotransferase [Aquamicrobium defluvii]